MSKVSAEYYLVITDRTSRVYEKLGIKPTLVYEVPEDRLSSWAPTNVPCT
jgi:hypothetical protein